MKLKQLRKTILKMIKMYLCPKCHNEISKSIKQCSYCGFKLKISLGRYQNRELKLHDDVKNRKIIFNQNMIDSKFKQIEKVDRYISRNSFKKALINLDINSSQAEVLRYKIISQIFANKFNVKSKKLSTSIKNVYFGYENELNASPTVLLTNLKYLFQLTGYEKFTPYYKNLLSKNRLPTNSGVKILGYIMYDVLNYNVKKEEIESRLLYHIDKENYYRNKNINFKLKQYYRVTGKYYFSKRFDSIIEIYKLSVKQAFEIKEKVLIVIYLTNSRQDIKELFDKTVLQVVKKKKPTGDIPKKRKLGSKTSQYVHRRNNEYGVLGDYYK